MNRIKYWIEAMRLRTLPVSVAGVIAAIGYNISSGSFKFLPPCSALLLQFYVRLLQISQTNIMTIRQDETKSDAKAQDVVLLKVTSVLQQ